MLYQITGKETEKQGLPWVWKTTATPLNALLRSINQTYRWEQAVETDSKIYSLLINGTTTPDEVFGAVYDTATNTWDISTTDLAATAASSSPVMLFVDSNESMFTSTYDAADKAMLYKSSDGGDTWTQVIDTDAHSGTENGEVFFSMVEALSGTLFAAVYPRDNVDPVLHLYKSTDGGDTWTDISSNIGLTKSGAHNKHIHSIYYCPYRNTLFVCIGDGGATQYMAYSNNEGSTFSTWLTQQVISMTSDEKYLYFFVEVTANDDTSVYRTDTVGGTLTKVKDVSFAGNGYAWNCFSDNTGVVWGLYGWNSTQSLTADLFYSDDYGETWYSETISSVDTWGRYRSCYSENISNTRTRLNHISGRSIKVYKDRHQFNINQATGGSPFFGEWSGDYSDIPIKIKQGKLALTDDYSTPFMPYAGTIIDRGAFTLGATSSPTSSVAETFEGSAPTFGFSSVVGNGTGGNSVTAETTIIKVGSQSAKLICDGTNALYFQHNTAYSGVAAEQVAAFDGWFYFTAALGDGMELMRFVNCTRLIVDTSFGGVAALAINTQATPVGHGSYMFQELEPVEIPTNKWVHIKILYKKSQTSGYIKVYQDHDLVLNIDGVPTWNGSAAIAALRVGSVIGTAYTGTMYVDDFKYGEDDQESSAQVLDHTPITVLPDGITA